MGMIKALTSLDELVWNACSKVTDAGYKVGLDKYDLSQAMIQGAHIFMATNFVWNTIYAFEQRDYLTSVLDSIVCGFIGLSARNVKTTLIEKTRQKDNDALQRGAAEKVEFNIHRPLAMLLTSSLYFADPNVASKNDYLFFKTVTVGCAISAHLIIAGYYFLSQYPRPPAAKKSPFKEYISRLREYVAKPVRQT